MLHVELRDMAQLLGWGQQSLWSLPVVLQSVKV